MRTVNASLRENPYFHDWRESASKPSPDILSRMGTAPAADPSITIDEDTLRRIIPPYRVILHNDDHNTMDHVVRTLLRCIPALSPEEAEQIMWTAHTCGQATVIECPKETAEHYRNCLESAGLTATIEPA